MSVPATLCPCKSGMRADSCCELQCSHRLAELAARYRHANQTAKAGGDWAQHIGTVSSLVEEATRNLGGGRKRALVCGPGNCRDIPLLTLLQEFEEVWLVDIDVDSVRDFCMSLNRPRRAQCVIRQLDLSSAVPQGTTSPMGHLEKSSSVEWPFGEFDLSLSICVASQILATPSDFTLDRRRLSVEERLAYEAATKRHAELLLAVTKPGGAVVWATDFLDSRASGLPEVLEVFALSAHDMKQAIQRMAGSPCSIAGAWSFIQAVMVPTKLSESLMKAWLWGFRKDAAYLVVGGLITRT